MGECYLFDATCLTLPDAISDAPVLLWLLLGVHDYVVSTLVLRSLSKLTKSDSASVFGAVVLPPRSKRDLKVK